MSNLTDLEILGSPFDDNLMLKMLQSLQQLKIKLNLDGQITEKGLISIPKEIRKKIIQIKLYNSSINLHQNENDMIDFLNDLNDGLTVCCLNFREFGPTNKILKIISNRFKELQILNIQGKLTIEKYDFFHLINQLEKIEMIYFDSPINNCTIENVEEFKKNFRLMTGRVAPKIIIPVNRQNSNHTSTQSLSKEIIRNPKSNNCLLMKRRFTEKNRETTMPEQNNNAEDLGCLSFLFCFLDCGDNNNNSNVTAAEADEAVGNTLREMNENCAGGTDE
ncbi:hypothetical protein ABK040_007583 [Willaertia magna]